MKTAIENLTFEERNALIGTVRTVCTEGEDGNQTVAVTGTVVQVAVVRDGERVSTGVLFAGADKDVMSSEDLNATLFII